MRNKGDFSAGIVVAVILALCIGAIVFVVHALVKYADTPISEVPLWVAWLLFGGSGK